MGKITILKETTKNPISLIGERAGICWGSDISDPEKNYKRGLECIKSQHGRTLEYVNVEMILDGYSARCIREWYTHIGCLPTRLQASTRYINYEDFDFYMPKTINTKEKRDIYYETIKNIKRGCLKLKGLGVPREDIANLLPLGMTTRVVDKRNLRNLIDMSHQRICNRALLEYRQLFADICNALSSYSEEWKTIVHDYFKPKCLYLGYCPETKSCGLMPKERSEPICKK